MATRVKNGLVVFLALIAIYAGAFTAMSIVGGKQPVVAAASLHPMTKPDTRVVGTFFIPAGNQSFCVNPPVTCIVSQVPLATQPVAIDCTITIGSPADGPPTEGTHSCSEPRIANGFYEVTEFRAVWSSGFLSLWCDADCSTNDVPITLTYSAVV